MYVTAAICLVSALLTSAIVSGQSAPDVPNCPPVAPSVGVNSVACFKGNDKLDCSLPMSAGSFAVSYCNPGYIAGIRKKKLATCAKDGTWSNAAASCLQVDPCQPSPCGANSRCVATNSQVVCTCLPTYSGSPPSCRHECEVNSDCSDTQVCRDFACLDACHGACAGNTRCTVVQHSPLTGDPLTGYSPIPVIPCPAIPTSEAVQFVICVRDMELVDCSQDLLPGTLAVLRCSERFLAGNSNQKTSTCLSTGSWSNADFTCSEVAPSDYKFHAGLGYYKVHTTPATWHTANKTCADEGGHLAIVNSKAEFVHIEDIRDNRVGGQQAFLGFTDMATEGTFVTIFVAGALAIRATPTTTRTAVQCILIAGSTTFHAMTLALSSVR